MTAGRQFLREIIQITGTKRYLSLGLLDSTVTDESIEVFNRASVNAFGLVMWEAARLVGQVEK